VEIDLKMTEQEILEALETILYNAEHTNQAPGLRFYARIGYESGDPYPEYYNKTIELLRALYQKLITEKEKIFLLKSFEPKPAILTLLPNQPKVNRMAFAHQDFIFVFFIKIKELDKALNMITNYITVSASKNDIFQALSEILAVEPNTFDNIKLNQILSILENFQRYTKGLQNYLSNSHLISGEKRIPMYDVKMISSYKASDPYRVKECEHLLSSIKDKIYKIKEERLSSFLKEGINYEINQDQKELQNIITEFGFNKKLNETLLKINEKLYEAKDPFDFKNCIDLTRALLNELCISIGLEIQAKKKIQPSLAIDSMGRARQYFRDNRVNFLSQGEDDFIGKYNEFISDTGVHVLQSEREYARIAKNLVIELGLFLAEKLKKYLSR